MDDTRLDLDDMDDMDDKPRKLDIDPPEEKVVPDKVVVEKYDADFITELLDALDDLGDDGDQWEEFGRKVARMHPGMFTEVYLQVQRDNHSTYKANDGDAPF